MKKRIVLCADDYGQAPEISQGIISLIEAGRLSATSCMMNTPNWPEHAQWLLPYSQQVDIGLHFNLTQGSALSGEYIKRYGRHFDSISSVLIKAGLHQLDYSAIYAECRAQMGKFLDSFGFLPQFIDGHQHVHQFPIVRLALLRAYEELLRPANAYVRLVDEKFKWQDIFQSYKKLIIYASGSRAFSRLLAQRDIPHNTSFAGIYSLAAPLDYRSLFIHFLNSVQDGGLIMCHPGLAALTTLDPIAGARDNEYRYFASATFLVDCATAEVEISRRPAVLLHE